jgi:hypothetical protein
MASIGTTINQAVLQALGMVGFYCLVLQGRISFSAMEKERRKKENNFLLFG